MKTFNLVVLTLFLSLSALRAQDDYHVIFVKGLIVQKANQAPLKRGDKINAGTEIVFKSPDAIATVLSQTKGRFNLKPEMSSGAGSSEFVAYVKNVLSPPNPRLSSNLSKSVDLTKLKEKDKVRNILVLKSANLKVDKEKYPTNKNDHFVLSTMNPDAKGKNAILYHLETTEGNVGITRKSIQWIRKKSGPKSEISLGYLTVQEPKVNLETFPGIVFHTPDLKELKKSVAEIIEVLKAVEADKDEKLEEIKGFLSDQFGEVDDDDLNAWLAKEFDGF